MDRFVFLDRDGVINTESADYIKTPSEFEFIHQSPEAIALLCQNGFSVIVVTNQSLIGRKMASMETLSAIFQKMTRGIEDAGGWITDIFFCPHTPQDLCTCRKPAPGLILEAQKKYGIDLGTACMVGDKTTDIDCGKTAGCSTTILVKTGYGETALDQLAKENHRPDHVAQNLYDAAVWIVEHLKNP